MQPFFYSKFGLLLGIIKRKSKRKFYGFTFYISFLVPDFVLHKKNNNRYLSQTSVSSDDFLFLLRLVAYRNVPFYTHFFPFYFFVSGFLSQIRFLEKAHIFIVFLFHLMYQIIFCYLLPIHLYIFILQNCIPLL